jgi:predicted AlkP superfamily pyrophosphatase or phosphodiesterase
MTDLSTPEGRDRVALIILFVLIFTAGAGLNQVYEPPYEEGPDDIRLIIIFSIDSLNAEYLHSTYMPNLYRVLSEEGVIYTNARTVLASETQSGHTSMLTGAYPCTTGIVGNGWYDLDAGEDIIIVTDHRYRLAETIFEAIEPADSVKTAFVSGKWRLIPLLSQEVDVVIGPPREGPPLQFDTLSYTGIPIMALLEYDAVDLWTMSAAIEVITREDPDLMFVNLAWTDDIGHIYGADSTQLFSHLRELDTLFMQLFHELKIMGRYESTLIVITSDHGMDKKENVLPIDTFLAERGVSAKLHIGGEIANVYLENPADKSRVLEMLEAHKGVEDAIPSEEYDKHRLHPVRCGDITVSAKAGWAFSWGRYPVQNHGQHGGLPTMDVALAFMGPSIKKGCTFTESVCITAIVPTIGYAMREDEAWTLPPTVEGEILYEIFEPEGDHE